MLRLRSFAPVVLALVVTSSQAQLRGNSGAANIGNFGNVSVRVVFPDERNAGPHLLIRLMSGSSTNVIMTTYTNEIGEAHFVGVQIGEYHVEVSGEGVRTTESDQFEVDSRKMTQSQYVVVNRAESTVASARPLSAHSQMVSAADLNVPDKARKEVDKANDAMAEQNWKKAQEHLEKAIALAPNYVTAYNNLGILYDKINDIPKEEEALSKAVELDGHFAPALVNYGKVSLRQKDPVKAEALLQKASVADPGNPETLMLLAYAQFINRHFDPAISNALQSHSVGPDHPSFVHYIAARSYQQENQIQQAIAQFQIFLKEEPKGPRADHVREDVAKLQQAQQASAQ